LGQFLVISLGLWPGTVPHLSRLCRTGLDQYCTRELDFWKVTSDRLKIKLVTICSSKTSNYVVYSDASATGCGAHLDVNGEQVCHKLWDVEERGKSSTWREKSVIVCPAVVLMLTGFLIVYMHAKLYRWGARKVICKLLFWKLFSFVLIIVLGWNFHWIPRTEIDRADYISRL